MGNQVAQFILNLQYTGHGDGQLMASDLVNIDKITKQLAFSQASLNAALGQNGNITPRAASGLTGLGSAGNVANQGMRNAQYAALGLASALGSGPMNPAALLEVGRGLVFIGASGAGVSLGLPEVLGMAAALTAIGFAINRHEQDAQKAAKADEAYAKALADAREEYDKLRDSLRRGTLPSAEESENALKKMKADRALAKANLDDLTTQLGDLQQLQDRVAENPLPPSGEGDLPPEGAFRQRQIETLAAQIAQKKADLAGIDAQIAKTSQIPTADAEKQDTNATEIFTTGLQQRTELLKAALDQRNNLRAAQVKDGTANELDAFDAEQKDKADAYRQTLSNLELIRLAHQRSAEQAQLTGDKSLAEEETKLAEQTGFEIEKTKQSEQGRLNILSFARNEIVTKNAEATAKLESELRTEAAKTTDNQLEAQEAELQQRLNAIREQYVKDNPGDARGLADLDENLNTLKALGDRAIQAEELMRQVREQIQAIERAGEGERKGIVTDQAAGLIAKQSAAQDILNSKLAEQKKLEAELVLLQQQLAKGGNDEQVKKLQVEIEQLKDKIKELAPTGKETAAATTGAFNAIKASIEAVGPALTRSQQAAQIATTAMETRFTSLSSALQQSGGAAFKAWITGSESAGKAFKQMLGDILTSILTTIVEAAAMAVILEVINAIPIVGPTVVSLIGAGSISAFVGALASAGGKAEGGPVYGPGSTTSDSILTPLSNKEFVHTAAAHEYLGTERMHAINQRRVSPEAIDAAMGRGHRGYATGGAVGGGFAGAGFVRSGDGSPVSVSVSSGPTYLALTREDRERLAASSEFQQQRLNQDAKTAVRSSRFQRRDGGHRQES